MSPRAPPFGAAVSDGRRPWVPITRRGVLGAGVALSALALPRRLQAQGRLVQGSLLLDGIGPGLEIAALDGVLDPLLAAGLPVTCIVDLLALAAPDAAGRPLCDHLARRALEHPGLFDLALPIGKLPRPERYFQMRRAGGLRRAVVAAFGMGPAADRAFPVVTLVDRGDDPNIDHTAFRGAGFRIHLRAGDDSYSRMVAGRGELVLTGGIWSRLDAPEIETRLSSALTRQEDLLLSLSLAGIRPETMDEMTDHARRIARQLGNAVAEGQLRLASPARLRLFDGNGLAIDLALLVEPGVGVDEEAAVMAFLGDMVRQGIPLTLTGPAGPYGELPGTARFCAPSTVAPVLPPPDCQRATSSGAGLETTSVAVLVHEEASVWPVQGLDAAGHLRLAPRRLQGGSGLSLGLSPVEDHVIAVRPADILQPVRRTELVRDLVEASHTGQVHFHTIPGLAEHLIAPEPVLERLWSVRRRVLTDPILPPAPGAEERLRLIEDARLAWRFIERFSDPETGLCAGTVQAGPVEVVNREATMWDIASQLHGIRVAHQLGFITRKDAEARVLQMIENLPTGQVEGLRLPPAMFRTDEASVVTPGFDICDLGRFLIALRAVVQADLLDATIADTAVAAWDLAAALPDGRPHSHVDGAWVDTTLSHCTAYIRRGLASWGFSPVSPYKGLALGSDTDRQIALLYDVARIGQVGVEPVLLDLIEQGPDPEADLIADVLFDAQLDWFETTGTFKCASEAPLNFPPWFSYQGLRFGHLGDKAWVVRGLGGAAIHDTAEFRAKAELLSTKSAYLWSALRAHDWCDQLLHLIRDKTRIEDLGFSVGVFTGTMEAMPYYTDLNTNGVILTAIGHVLR